MLLIIILLSVLIYLNKVDNNENFTNIPKQTHHILYPPIPLNHSCKLNFNKTNNSKYVSDKNMSVALNCNNNKQNYYNLNKPIYVRARTVGRTRALRQIN